VPVNHSVTTNPDSKCDIVVTLTESFHVGYRSVATPLLSRFVSISERADMSCFPGTLKEFKGISLDHFGGRLNLQSTVYFLSHCHSDHMVGLDSKDLADRFADNTFTRLYCTPVTKALLRGLNRFTPLLLQTITLEVSHVNICDVMQVK
jgi:ribonuclease BN (tRNA processing enzyme)